MAAESRSQFQTLVKHPNLHIVLILMKAKTQMSEHHVDAHISIHVLQGRIVITLPDQKTEVGEGELLALDYGIPHDVEAIEESAFLITISWPGGTKEQRHADTSNRADERFGFSEAKFIEIKQSGDKREVWNLLAFR
jgi:quercetin dioxygenase-like cupin family protein